MNGTPVWSVLVLVLGVGGSAWAQQAPLPPIYTCVNAAGKKLTSDRPIAECNDREQRVLNSDGSVRQVIGPTLTADERAAAEARMKEVEVARAQRAEAVRSDRNLMNRFPNEAAHNKARAKALDNINGSLQASEDRLAKLAKERKPLTDDAEFYIGKPLPSRLKGQLDANDAATDAQLQLVQTQKLEAVRIEQNFNAELERLKRLWAGAQPGSLGALPVAPPPSTGKVSGGSPTAKK